MCGLTGAIGAFDASIERAVQSMLKALAHRGPNGQGLWQSKSSTSAGAVLLGHRRLSIFDLREIAGQPMVDAQTGCALIFNGAIYNFHELRTELVALGHSFLTNSDTEVLLKAYVSWGEDCVRQFRGMYAFVIYDPRTNAVFMARDRLGIKPLYLARVSAASGGETLLFASELRAILASGLVARRFDRVGLAGYLWHGFVPGYGTIVEGVELLEPGTTRTIRLADLGTRVTRYWQLPAASTRADAVEQLEHELEQAVKLRLLSDVPLGLFLSGGVDSSALAALAVRAAGREAVSTVTIGFDDAKLDESKYAREMAAALGTRHREVRISHDVFTAQLDAALHSIDQPTFDHINSYLVSRAAREAGLTVALSGAGGDELFGGYRTFTDVPRLAAWGRRLRFVPRRAMQFAAAQVTRYAYGRPGRIAPQTRWAKLGQAMAARGSLLDIYQISYALFLPDLARQLSSLPAVDEVESGLSRARRAQLETIIGSGSVEHAISLLELSSFIGDRLLRDTDAASMAVALEVRLPLLDHRVVEAAAAVETSRRYLPMRSKRLLKQLALRDVAPSLYERPKSGFELPIEKWCRGQLGTSVGETLRDPQLCARVGLRAETVADLWQAFQDGAPGLYWSRVWALYILMWWAVEYEMRLD
ncbi:MAG: asparagine synthase (glutamine-hydrolyzing) [Planctomycetota bacterium]